MIQYAHATPHTRFVQGIELGHVFYLGTKYSKPMGATFKSREGQEVPLEMGCYGLGISRTIASIVETHCDDKGIIWPESVAPYRVCVIPVGDATSLNVNVANSLIKRLSKTDVAGDVVLDDRFDRSPGFRLKDAELIGFPWVCVIGRSYEKGAKVEVQRRGCPDDTRYLTLEQCEEFFRS